MIQAYLDRYTGSAVCSKQLYKEALNHPYDEPKQWEIREVNDIMNHCVTGWRYFSNPRIFEGYGRQKAGNAKPRQRALTTGPKKPRRALWKSQSRWSCHFEKSGEKPADCDPVAIPLPGQLPGNSLSLRAFLPSDNQNNQKIKEKVNSNPTARQR